MKKYKKNLSKMNYSQLAKHFQSVENWYNRDMTLTASQRKQILAYLTKIDNQMGQRHNW